ncbi:hypothetical protein PHET_04484 [Paragonimus heterotremus]|uniref:Uncharacterized protein n=1 Tax=Paragonimus heterotremus TaxID=100268 RepID=A0A8J4SMN9_9TREM|nr:hypothetical protein PHET_04484 [Paragonimus heterotremus]
MDAVYDTGVCSVENLQNKLITALRALQLEHKSHEELEQARDAAESRLRNLTLKMAGMKAVDEFDGTFRELMNSTEINQLTLLRTEIVESKFRLAAEQDERKNVEQALKESQRWSEEREKHLLKLEEQKLESETELIHLNEQLKAVEGEKKKADTLLQEALSEIQLYKVDIAKVGQLKTFSPEKTLIQAEPIKKSNFGCQYPVCEDVGTDVQSLVDIGELHTTVVGQMVDAKLISENSPANTYLSKRTFEWDKLVSEYDRLQDSLKNAEKRLSSIQEADRLLFEKLILVVTGKDDDPWLTARMNQLPQSEQQRLHACFSLFHKSQELKRTSLTELQEAPENPEIPKLNQNTLEEFMKLLTSTEERVNQLHFIMESSKRSHEVQVNQLREQLTASEAQVMELKVALETKEQKSVSLFHMVDSTNYFEICTLRSKNVFQTISPSRSSKDLVSQIPFRCSSFGYNFGRLEFTSI